MSKWDVLNERIKQMATREVAVGWFESAMYDDNTPVAQVAATQEFGAPGANIPPRPFFHPCIAEHSEEWSEKIAKGMKAVFDGKIEIDQVLDAVGGLAAGQLQRQISEVREPPLAPSTLAQRAREGRTDQPLHRTGHMIDTVKYLVRDKE